MNKVFRVFGIMIVLLLMTAPSAFAVSFHDQAPMTNAEVEQFAKDFPAFKQWMFENKVTAESAKPTVDASGNPSFIWDDQVAAWFLGKEWTPERFFYVMTHCSAAISIIRKGDALTGANRPADMPAISEYEMNLVRQYEEMLLKSLTTKIK